VDRASIVSASGAAADREWFAASTSPGMKCGPRPGARQARSDDDHIGRRDARGLGFSNPRAPAP
jgi:hypothetical protein